MLKNSKILPIFGAALIAVVTAIITVSVVSPGYFNKPYSVISTPSGFYVARVSYPVFSSFVALRNAYVLNDVRNDENQVVDQQLIPVSDNTLWGPKVIYLSRDQIVFKGYVGKGSLIDKTIRCSVENVSARPVDCPQPQSQNNNPILPPPTSTLPTSTR